MNYKEKILELIFNENDDALMAWIGSQPLIEQPDIFRELKQLVEEIGRERGAPPGLNSKEMAEWDKKINEYEEKILTEKLAEDNYIMALEQQEKASKQIDETVAGIRKYIVDCIVTNAPNAKEMRKLAKEMIKLDKESGVYNPEDWKGI